MQGKKANILDYINKQIGNFKITGEAPITCKYGFRVWATCLSCNSNKSYLLTDIVIKKRKSCGCLLKARRERGNVTHGQSQHPLYYIRKSMIARCYNPNDKAYKNYGGRGVTVCEEWRNSFEDFFNWAISAGWQRGLQLDKDTKGTGLNYSPANCCFITSYENQNARRVTVFVEYKGERIPQSEFCRTHGIGVGLLNGRLKSGWTIEQIIEIPSKQWKSLSIKKAAAI